MDFSPELEAITKTSGASTPNNLRTLHALLHHLRPQRTLEVGLANGASALVFASHHPQHVAIDPFQADWQDNGLRAIGAAGLFIDFRREDSATVLPALLREGAKFGLIYVDGSHLVERVFIDAFYCARLLDDGGVVAFDDSTIGHVAKVLRFIRANVPGLKAFDLSAFHPNGNTLRYQLATRLHRAQLTAFQRVGEVERHWQSAFHSF